VAGGRQWYEVRVREEVGFNKWTKKSKFYFEKGPKEAEQHYHGQGHVMSVQKVPAERLLGVGDFFKLGDQLLQELRRDSVKETATKEENREKYFGKRRKEFNKEF